jgi:hypothetical protein
VPAVAAFDEVPVESSGTPVESDGIEVESIGVAEESVGTLATESPGAGTVVLGESDEGLSLSLPSQAAANVSAAAQVND